MMFRFSFLAPGSKLSADTKQCEQCPKEQGTIPQSSLRAVLARIQPDSRSTRAAHDKGPNACHDQIGAANGCGENNHKLLRKQRNYSKSYRHSEQNNWLYLTFWR